MFISVGEYFIQTDNITYVQKTHGQVIIVFNGGSRELLALTGDEADEFLRLLSNSGGIYQESRRL